MTGNKTYSSFKGKLLGPRKRIGLLPEESEVIKEMLKKRGGMSRVHKETGVHRDTIKAGIDSGMFEYHVTVKLKTYAKSIIQPKNTEGTPLYHF